MKIQYLGLQDFYKTWQAMNTFTKTRNASTEDELWVLEHPPVFTQGLAGKAEHILNTHSIPLIQTDRGGQVTYHGPGQIIIYVLFDLNRANMGVRKLVSCLEQGIIQFLASQSIQAQSDAHRPGVYIGEKKIASIGLRIKKGCSFHGISFNADMDLRPFNYINPCGYANLKMTDLKAEVGDIDIKKTQILLANAIQKQLHSESDPMIIRSLDNITGEMSDS